MRIGWRTERHRIGAASSAKDVCLQVGGYAINACCDNFRVELARFFDELSTRLPGSAYSSMLVKGSLTTKGSSSAAFRVGLGSLRRLLGR